MNVTAGTVYLAGAGPGDPGLLTLRALELLRQCDCIVYDALISPEVLAYANPTAEKVFAGKRASQHALEQSAINQLLAQRAQSGKTVLRLKGGDPYLFGRGAEEALYLTECGVRVEVVPGVTAGLAATAYAGIPVTHRDFASAVAFVTGHEDPSKRTSTLDWKALAKMGTLCFYMGTKNIGQIAGNLAKYAEPGTPAAVIEEGTTPRQRTIVGDLSTIEKLAQQANVNPPALLVVGASVKLHSRLNFFERTPLLGKRILVTRTQAQAGELSEGLRRWGAGVLEFPTINIVPSEGGPLKEAVAALAAGQFDWLILSSANGVDAVFAELYRLGLDVRSVKAKAAAIGPATAGRLREKGLRADLIPPQYLTAAVVETLKAHGEIQNQRFFLARADIAPPALPQALTQLGGRVTDVIAYCTLLETNLNKDALAALENGQVDAVTFTSASTARNFAAILGPERLQKALASARLRCFSIGPQTSAAMRACGLPIHAEAAVHDIPGLLAAILRAFAAGK
jgi:uroporphyrinogen III methyltransferase/synthase